MTTLPPSLRRYGSLCGSLLLAAVMLVAAGCGARKGAASVGGNPSAVATVNGEIITQDELNAELNNLKGREVLQDLINDRLIQQEAKKDKIAVTDQEVAERLAEVKASPQYLALVKANAVTDDVLKSKIRNTILLQKLILQEIPQRDLMMMYDQYHQKMEQAHIHDIVVDSKSDADKIERDLKAGKDFAAEARLYTKDQAARQVGGDIGWVAHAAPLEPSIAKAAFSLPLNQAAAPIKTRDGWHILLITGRKTTFDDLKTDIQDQLVAARQGQYLQRLHVKADIKTRYDTPSTQAEAPSSAASGSGQAARN